ncbi:MAG: RHS repeat-associated core domain-containing protein, partial [Pseudomonadota bacterium]
QAYFASEEYLYEYNAVGQRVSKSRWVSTGAGGGCLDYDREEVIVFLYDGGSNLIGEQIYTEPAGQACTDASVELVAQRDFVWVNDEPMIMQLTNYGPGYVVLFADTYFIHTDHLTTPRTVTDSAGALAWSRSESTAFGDGGGQKFSSTANFEMNLRFPGQYEDLETTLYYNFYRTYDPSIGRYLESDPIGLEGGLNVYAYALNNPLHYVDPTGANPVIVRIIKEIGKRLAGATRRKSPIKPDRRKGVWSCAVVACCNDNIPGNCPEDPKQWCKQAVWRHANRTAAIKAAERLAKQRLGCQAKHVTVRCTGPKNQDYQRGG